MPRDAKKVVPAPGAPLSTGSTAPQAVARASASGNASPNVAPPRIRSWGNARPSAAASNGTLATLSARDAVSDAFL